MLSLTIEQAVVYVATMETAWGLPPSAFYNAEHVGADPAFPIVRVITCDNIWDVWIENGEIYGEC